MTFDDLRQEEVLFAAVVHAQHAVDEGDASAEGLRRCGVDELSRVSAQGGVDKDEAQHGRGNPEGDGG